MVARANRQRRVRRVRPLGRAQLAIVIEVRRIENILRRSDHLFAGDMAITVGIEISKVPIDQPSEGRSVTHIASGFELFPSDDVILVRIVNGKGAIHVRSEFCQCDDAIFVGIQLKAMLLNPGLGLSLTCLRRGAVFRRTRWSVGFVFRAHWRSAFALASLARTLSRAATGINNAQICAGQRAIFHGRPKHFRIHLRSRHRDLWRRGKGIRRDHISLSTGTFGMRRLITHLSFEARAERADALSILFQLRGVGRDVIERPIPLRFTFRV